MASASFSLISGIPGGGGVTIEACSITAGLIFCSNPGSSGAGFKAASVSGGAP